MAPHFEPLAPDADDDSFFQPRRRAARTAPPPPDMPSAAEAPRAAAVPIAAPAPSASTTRPAPLDWPAQVAPARDTHRRGAWILAALLVLALCVGVMAWRELTALWSPPPDAATQAPQPPLRMLQTAVDECRGSESLLVMLPEGPERDETLQRLRSQQQRIDAWLRDQSAWMAKAHGAQALADLRDALGTWRQLQGRIVDAEADQAVTGRARESRSLMSGPSGEAYRQVVGQLTRLLERAPG